MSSPGFAIDVADHVATVWFDRPEKRNAVSAGMWRRLPALLTELSEDPAVRVVVFRGAGGDFSSGADLADLDELEEARIQSETGLTEDAEEAVACCAKPTLAAIEGYCLGGGCGLAVACDLRLASVTARFAVPAAKHDVVYPQRSTRRLARLVGASAALHLLYTAEQIDAARAQRIGLVDEVVPEEEFESRVSSLADSITMGAARTQAAAKAAVSLD